MFTIRANSQRFEELRKGRDYSTFARDLNVHQSTLTRIVKNGVAPGPRFIAQALQALPYAFDSLFDVVEAGGNNRG